MTLTPSLKLAVGATLEADPHLQPEPPPNVRLSWTPNEVGRLRGLRRGASRRALALAALMLLLVQGDRVAAQARTPEDAVKAAYLYKFAPFVEWPARVFASPAAPFSICVVGEDPFGEALDQAVRGQAVDGHRVVVRRLETVGGESGCQILYVGRSRLQPPADVLRALRGLPVLTVTDDADGVDGGVVHFELRDGRVRFSLDAGAAEAGGLALSSKLQELATRVRRPAE